MLTYVTRSRGGALPSYITEYIQNASLWTSVSPR
jgi:hypothetical protein